MIGPRIAACCTYAYLVVQFQVVLLILADYERCMVALAAIGVMYLRAMWQRMTESALGSHSMEAWAFATIKPRLTIMSCDGLAWSSDVVTSLKRHHN